MAAKRRPWISSRTLSYIDKRSVADATGSESQRKHLHRLVRASVKQEKEDWLHSLVLDRCWHGVQHLRKGEKKENAKLKDASGEAVSSAERADTFAAHLEQFQWAVRPCSAVWEQAPLGPPIHVDLSPCSQSESQAALSKLRVGRAAGCDGIPPDFWKVCLDSEQLFDFLLKFCNEVWSQKRIPDRWRTVSV